MEINEEQEKFIIDQVAESVEELNELLVFYQSKYGYDPFFTKAVFRLHLLKNVNYEYILTKYKNE